MDNTIEMATATTLMLTSCVIWAQTIAVFASVISAFNPDQNAFRATMDTLNRYIASEGIPRELAYRMRSYFHQSKHLRAAKQVQQLLASMPPTLQGEVSWETNKAWLENISFLRGCG